MNPKFYALPQAKQEAIIQAGYRVFGQHTYKKAPMSAIADAAGISKPLLFHYFHNKKELYFFLFDLLVQQTDDFLKEGGCYETLDFFELFKSVTQTKVQLARLNPDWLAFSLKTYYEQDPRDYARIGPTHETSQGETGPAHGQARYELLSARYRLSAHV